MTGTTQRWIWAASVILAIAAPLSAAPPDPVNEAVRAAVKVATAKQIDSVLLVVRTDPGSTGDLDPEGVIAQLTVAIRDGLEDGSLNVTVFEGKIHVTGKSLTPIEVSALAEADQADAVVSIDYRRKNSQRVVRMALVTDTATLWSKSVSQGTALATAKSSRAARRRNAASSSNTAVQTVPQGFGSSTGSASLSGLAGLSGFGLQSALANSGIDDGTGTSGDGDSGDEESSALNEKVLQFALDHLGEQVGNGECWTLAAEALKAAGARPARGYTFGRPIEMSEVTPGDILQFTSARFESATAWMVLGAPHHTAIVQAVKDENIVHVLHQNVNGDKTVQSMTLDFSTLVSGEVQAFRPVADDGEEGEEGGGGGRGRGRGEGGEGCRREGGGGINIDIDIDININVGDLGNDPETPDFFALSSSGR